MIELTLLAKSLIPVPEKFHGLRDTDMRYRRRYVDLFVNEEVRKAFVTRARVVSAMRSFLDGIGFMEVETPILQTTPGGANARPFITHHNTLDIDMYLRIATELHLKRLIVGGFEKDVYKRQVPVPQTDTGRRGENPKTSGRTLVKELGKMTP